MSRPVEDHKDEADDVNPYAAPAHATEALRVRAKGDLAHRHLKYLYLGALFAPMGLALLTVMSPSLMPLIGLLNIIVVGVAMYSFLKWVHSTWTLVPERLRVGVSPGAAAWSFFIPFYNFWWSFAGNFRIARALEETLAKYKTRVRAPTTLAWVAPLVPLGSMVLIFFAILTRTQPAPGEVPAPSGITMFLPFVALAPFITFAWMSRVDSCNEEILFLRAEKRARKERRARDE